MIITVTLNPSLDLAVEIRALARGEIIRATAAHLDPAGKGVNVSRALLANGVPSAAVLPCGGDEGAQLVRLLKAEGVEVLAVPITGRTRSNITLAEPDGTVTKVNEPGPTMHRADLVGAGDALLAGFLAAGARGAALAEGLAWGAAAVSLPGSRMPGPADLHRHSVTIHRRPALLKEEAPRVDLHT